MKLQNFLFFVIGLVSSSIYAKNTFSDSIPIVIKGKEFYLKNETDNDTAYYYIFTTADRNEVYDIRNKKVLWSRPLEERKYRPIWKKLPKKRKYKTFIRGKDYYKYFKNDSLVLLQKNYKGNELIQTIWGFYTYDSISETSMIYHIKSGKRISSKSCGYTRGWSNIDFLLNNQNNWEKKSIKPTNQGFHDHPIINREDIINDVPEQVNFVSEYKGYKKLSKVQTPSKKLKHITFRSEENLKDKILVYYNKNLKKLQFKKIENSVNFDTILILKGSKNSYKKFKPQEFIDISHFSKGLYYITIKSNSKNIVSYRLYLPK